VSFIARHADRPFFLYLAFNAPHLPLQAPPAYLERCAAIADPTRRTYAAEVVAMDDAIGKVLAALHERGLDETTLVFFLNDNGGPGDIKRTNGSSNAPLRGRKGGTFEGGIRVPFMARWKGTLPAGSSFEKPVITLDIFPTALALAGLEPDPEEHLDGVDLLPFLAGRASGAPHDVLYWSLRSPPALPQFQKWAVRKGDLKLVHVAERHGKGEASITVTFALFDVAHDPGETNDLLSARPDEARELDELWTHWRDGLPPLRATPRVKRPR